MKNYVLIAFVSISVLSCTFNDEPNLPPIEERVDEATSDLVDRLTSPLSGWRLDYQPTPTGGSFLLLMDFDNDGNVRIQSDLGINDGEFRDQTLPYRVDSRQGLELVLETYGIFHYFFEQQQATFGGEFQFDFITETSDGNLIFSSKTDAEIGQNTTLIFQPANPSDQALVSEDVASRLAQIQFRTPNLGGAGSYAPVNLYVSSSNTTISMTIDLDNRRLKVHGAALGETFEEISSDVGLNIDAQTTYTILNGSIVLAEPASFSYAGNDFQLSTIPIGESTSMVGSFCENTTDTLYQFPGNASGIGDFEMTGSLFQTHSSFLPGNFYSIGGAFVFDGDGNLIEEDIEEIFPGLAAFQWYYGLELNDGSLLNAVGIVTLDEFNNAEFYLRAFEAEQTGNFISLSFTGNDFITDEDASEELLSQFEDLMDEIFADGEVYILDAITIDDLIEFHNPCNGYSGFIFRA